MRPTDAIAAPDGWSVKTVREAVEIRCGLSWSKSQEHSEPKDGTVPVLRITNVQEHLDLSDILYLSGVPAKAKELKKTGKDWAILVGSNGNRSRLGLRPPDRIGIPPPHRRTIQPHYHCTVARSTAP